MYNVIIIGAGPAGIFSALELIKLKSKNNGNYIKNNFRYTLLEFFDMNVSKSYVLSRERYWKKVFDSVKHGYNDN